MRWLQTISLLTLTCIQFAACDDHPLLFPRQSHPITQNAKCGVSNNHATCLGSMYGDCCSQHGWCGSTSAYCGTGCQAEFGKCTGAKASPTTTSAKPAASSVKPSITSQKPSTLITKSSSATPTPTPSSAPICGREGRPVNIRSGTRVGFYTDGTLADCEQRCLDNVACQYVIYSGDTYGSVVCHNMGSTAEHDGPFEDSPGSNVFTYERACFAHGLTPSAP